MVKLVMFTTLRFTFGILRAEREETADPNVAWCVVCRILSLNP